MARKKKTTSISSEVKRMKLTELTPAAYNPRKMSVEAYQGLGRSIDRFGILAPIVWNKRSRNIVGGHQRFRYLQERGETETDVVVVDLDDQAEVALNITLNNRAIRGEFTSEAIALLETTEVQLGSAFNDIRLGDLFHDLERRFAKELKKKNKSQEPASTDFSVPPGAPPDTSKGQTEDEQVTIITCPHCKSRWKMNDNEIVFDSRTAGA